MRVRELTKKEFEEFKMLAFFKSLDCSNIDFENMANYVLDNISININSLINPNSVPGANRLLIDKLTVLLKEIIKGKEELKETFYGLIETININEIPKCARLSVILKAFIDSKSSKVLFRHKRLLAAIDEIHNLRTNIDLYNLEIDDILMQDVIKKDGKYLCTESYGNYKAVTTISYDIKEKRFTDMFVNLNHEKTKVIKIDFINHLI